MAYKYKLGVEERKTIVEAYQKTTMSAQDIADEMGVSTRTIYGILRDAGVVLRKTSGTFSVDMDKVIQGIEMYMGTEKSVLQICEELEISTTALYHYMRVNEVPLRNVEKAKRRDAIMDAAIDAYMGGAKMWELERDFPDLGLTAFYVELRVRGIGTRKSTDNRQVVHQKIQDLKKDAQTRQEQMDALREAIIAKKKAEVVNDQEGKDATTSNADEGGVVPGV